MARPRIAFPPDPYYVTLGTRPRAANKIDAREEHACVHARRPQRMPFHKTKRDSVSRYEPVRNNSQPYTSANPIDRALKCVIIALHFPARNIVTPGHVVVLARARAQACAWVNSVFWRENRRTNRETGGFNFGSFNLETRQLALLINS
jgi:hypothetical protein